MIWGHEAVGSSPAIPIKFLFGLISPLRKDKSYISISTKRTIEETIGIEEYVV